MKKGVHCIIVKKTIIFDAGMVVFLNAINVYIKQKTVYFAVCSSVPHLRIQIFLWSDFFCTMEHVWFFLSPGSDRKW